MPPKKDDAAGLRQLKADLKAGTPGSCYIFYGEEAYLRDFYLGRLKDLLLPAGMEEFNLHTLVGKGFTLRALEEAVDCLPMMSERTLILVSDLDLFKAAGEIRDGVAALLAALPDYVCLVFLYDLIEYKPDARTKLAAALKDHATVVKFARQDQGDLIDWVKRRFKALDKEIDSELARYLIFLCGDLMNTLIGEIGKIGAYAKNFRITKEDIDAVAAPQLDAVVFQMTDALGAGNFDKAAAVLADLLHMQEAPIKLLTVLGKQMRQLYSARLALEDRKGAGAVAELWGMRSSYPAEKLMSAARRFDLDWCRAAVRRCGEVDLAMKSTGADGEALLVGLLMELAATPAKR